jgi:hypothetical protein
VVAVAADSAAAAAVAAAGEVVVEAAGGRSRAGKLHLPTFNFQLPSSLDVEAAWELLF